jgi:hypothetical protein
MRMTKDSGHAPSETPGEKPVKNTPEATLSAKEHLDRRLTSIEADAASKVAFSSEYSSDQVRGLTVCRARLEDMLKPGWLSKQPELAEAETKAMEHIRASYPDRAAAAESSIKEVFKGISRDVHQQEIKKTAFLIYLLREVACLEHEYKYLMDSLKSVDSALGSNKTKATRQAQSVLKENAWLIKKVVKLISDSLEANSPETVQAKRTEKIQQLTARALSQYRCSDEYRALKLLALVQDGSLKDPQRKSAANELARKLSPHGPDGVERILRGCASSLRIERKDLAALRRVFKELGSSNKISDTATSTSQPLGANEPAAMMALMSNEVDTAPALATTNNSVTTEFAQEIAPENDPETLALKELMLEQLGVVDSAVRQSLATKMTVQGIENAETALGKIPVAVTKKLLECNPTLLDPNTGHNLPTFCQELKEFIDRSYDLLSSPVSEIFDPLSTPSNFNDPAVLKRTKKAAAVYRLAKKNVEGREDTRD